MYKIIIALFVSASFTSEAFSASNSLGPLVTKVTNVGTFGNGDVFVDFDEQIASCSTSKRIKLEAGNPSTDEVYSLALAAFAMGKK